MFQIVRKIQAESSTRRATPQLQGMPLHGENGNLNKMGESGSGRLGISDLFV